MALFAILEPDREVGIYRSVVKHCSVFDKEGFQKRYDFFLNSPKVRNNYILKDIPLTRLRGQRG